MAKTPSQVEVMGKVNVELTPEQILFASERTPVLGTVPAVIVEAVSDCAFYFDLPVDQRSALDAARRKTGALRRDYLRSILSRHYAELQTSGRVFPKPLPPPEFPSDFDPHGPTRTTVSVPFRLSNYIEEREVERPLVRHVLVEALDDIGTYFSAPPDQRQLLERERAALSKTLGEVLTHREHIRIILSDTARSLSGQ
ncbi:hypothetical protein QEG98_42125 (plasmid) [Myxococcus sp. MxC21-1]|uniref:hypothetical protein n=1 Tax=Myxococcus sp. MxC21-1 TaxID=3041439 RepID=UPI00292E8C34|nr:hypothetical protein [Myxococcus sp. MxC21-1]WNZ66219.1 hypothetical protein QEG98_42125 [Myxococcus sp. MxC21-1]